jgi:hypothetical protein
VSPVKYEPGFCIPEDGIIHSHRREDLISYWIVSAREFCESCVLLALVCRFSLRLNS